MHWKNNYDDNCFSLSLCLSTSPPPSHPSPDTLFFLSGLRCIWKCSRNGKIRGVPQTLKGMETSCGTIQPHCHVHCKIYTSSKQTHINKSIKKTILRALLPFIWIGYNRFFIHIEWIIHKAHSEVEMLSLEKGIWEFLELHIWTVCIIKIKIVKMVWTLSVALIDLRIVISYFCTVV